VRATSSEYRSVKRRRIASYDRSLEEEGPGQNTGKRCGRVSSKAKSPCIIIPVAILGGFRSAVPSRVIETDLAILGSHICKKRFCATDEL
jgi:hypothetical protein